MNDCLVNKVCFNKPTVRLILLTLRDARFCHLGTYYTVAKTEKVQNSSDSLEDSYQSSF